MADNAAYVPSEHRYPEGDEGASDRPEPIETLPQARAAAEEYARLANTPMSTNDPGLMWATLAVASELRALTLILEGTLGR